MAAVAKQKIPKHVGLIGVGVVGGAMKTVFTELGITVWDYDKFKPSGRLVDVCDCAIIFLCLPTPYEKRCKGYNTKPIHEICAMLRERDYRGIVVLKSTVEPGTTAKLAEAYELNMVHNPEFLSARTCEEDFRNQQHVVLGNPPDSLPLYRNCVADFYRHYFPGATVSLASSTETEMMKIWVNSFYAIKIQVFNEMYMAASQNGADYNVVLAMMLENGWINPMHTRVPGSDCQLSYGGMCFPKDTNALNWYLKRLGTPRGVLDACIHERNLLRDD